MGIEIARRNNQQLGRKLIIHNLRDIKSDAGFSEPFLESYQIVPSHAKGFVDSCLGLMRVSEVSCMSLFV